MTKRALCSISPVPFNLRRPENMANYSVWNVRLRHEWLAKPLKKKRVKRRQAARIGLLDAWERNADTSAEAPAEQADGEAEASES